MQSEAIKIALESLTIKDPVIPEHGFHLRDFGGVGDGIHMNTEHFQQAIAACRQAGGGWLTIPAGTWLTGPIHLCSNLGIRFEKGAVLQFSPQFADYLPVVFTRWEGHECYNYSPLIYAKDCENVVISGPGTINGNGAAWWHWKQLQHAGAERLYNAEFNEIAVRDRVYGNETDALRPSMMQFINGKDILVEGITLVNGPMWTLHPVYCENVVIRDIAIQSEGPNTDGVNIDSCRNVIVAGSRFATGDDCIAIISGINEDGWRVNRPTENVVVRDCFSSEGHGSVSIGSGVSGGIRNILVRNCRFSGGERGIRLKSMRGRGGYIEHIWFEDIEIANMREAGIEISMYYPSSTMPSNSDAPSRCQNIHFRNILGEKLAQTILMKGLPELPADRIFYENVRMSGKKGLEIQDVNGIGLDGVEITVADR